MADTVKADSSAALLDHLLTEAGVDPAVVRADARNRPAGVDLINAHFYGRERRFFEALLKALAV